jgi:hypothetical protein
MFRTYVARTAGQGIPLTDQPDRGARFDEFFNDFPGCIAGSAIGDYDLLWR